jgi:hypothetical protein
MAWNCKANSYMNQQPPRIGSTDEQQRDVPFIKGSAIVPEGIYDSYKCRQRRNLSQLKERKGEQAVKNLRY